MHVCGSHLQKENSLWLQTDELFLLWNTYLKTKKSRWVVGQTGFSLGFFYADWKRHSKSPTADAKVISSRIFLEFQALLFDVRKSKLTLKLTTRKRSRFWQRAKPKIYAREKNWWWWAKQQHQDWVCNSNIYRKVFVSPQQNLSAKIPRNHFGWIGWFFCCCAIPITLTSICHPQYQ